MKKVSGILFFLLLFTLAGSAFANQREIGKSIQYAKNAYIVESSAVFEYIDGAQYQINTKVGYVTDITLGAGEDITYIAGGETVRWVFDVSRVGDVSHVYVRPVREDIDTNLIINTTKRIYRILLVSGDWYNPVVSWTYPLEERQKEIFEENLYVEQNKNNAVSPEALNFGYRTRAKGSGARAFLPEQVFDDGHKTFIRLPKNIDTSNYPVLYVTEGKTSSLVNFRVKDNYIILDRLFDKAQLVIEKQSVTIERLKRG